MVTQSKTNSENDANEKMSETVTTIGIENREIKVTISNETVQLLSEQLYQSPLKAIEELVVNSYDADATECRVFVPNAADTEHEFIVVYDDGFGMDEDGLENLWQIGRSKKREQENRDRRFERKQIGKFGIGKLATYTVARNLTYITKIDREILSVTVDFEDFSEGSSEISPVYVYVRQISRNDLIESKKFGEICELTGVNSNDLFGENNHSWTFAILESLKDKAREIHVGRLRWVLRTAMPLEVNFDLFLNNNEVASSKKDYKKVFEFKVSELPESRIESLRSKTRENWQIEDDKLMSTLFPNGITGTMFVSEKTLLGKSDDLQRSHGFFIYVRGRLINQEDALFGIKPTQFATFYRMRADIHVDDLDEVITASREGAEESKLKTQLKILLNELANYARSEYNQWKKEQDKKETHKNESERNFVSPRLVQHPIADIVASQKSTEKQNDEELEANGHNFFVDAVDDDEITQTVQNLYTNPAQKYRYEYTSRGYSSRIGSLNPTSSVFHINDDHPLVRNYTTDGASEHLLKDVVTAEVLLEVYLREVRVPSNIIEEILEKRDQLWRSLVKDHPISLREIAQSLRESAADERDLEINLVTAVRALGFVAKQISGSGEPDGIARLNRYKTGPKIIILEAKSTTNSAPSLPSIDTGGLHQHMRDRNADGCLLVAKDYPGEKQDRDDDSSIARRANNLKISCWTVNQLADFVEKSEAHQLTARHLLDIVLNHFAPQDVETSLANLFSEVDWSYTELYQSVLNALGQAEKVRDSVQRIPLTDITLMVPLKDERFKGKNDDIEKAVKELVSSSKGAMSYDPQDDSIILHASFDEIRRRVSNLTNDTASPRRRSNFRDETK